jgi:UDP-N-acetylmuramoyl-tripeptide--D-alanyl-D-alanine ligase
MCIKCVGDYGNIRAGYLTQMVSKKVESSLPTLVVENTQDALSKIATWHLHNIKPKVIAITGSNGKTTLKNEISKILTILIKYIKLNL